MTLKYEIYLRKEAGDFVLDSSCENEEKCLIDYITGVLKCAPSTSRHLRISPSHVL
jgi:hypothetical protein